MLPLAHGDGLQEEEVLAPGEQKLVVRKIEVIKN
jgi:hypothetical protein